MLPVGRRGQPFSHCPIYVFYVPFDLSNGMRRQLVASYKCRNRLWEASLHLILDKGGSQSPGSKAKPGSPESWIQPSGVLRRPFPFPTTLQPIPIRKHPPHVGGGGLSSGFLHHHFGGPDCIWKGKSLDRIVCTFPIISRKPGSPFTGMVARDRACIPSVLVHRPPRIQNNGCDGG